MGPRPADREVRDFISHPSSFIPSEWAIAAAVIVGTAAVAAVRAAGGREWTDTFTAYVLAIVLSATPYILLGACLSGIVEVFLPPTVLVSISRRLGAWGVPATAFVAPIFPICECGVVPVMRSLLRKGLPLHYALTYLLAAPIVNPIVLASTYMAFQDIRHPIFRGLGGLAVSIGIGYAFSRVKPECALRPSFLAECANGSEIACGRDPELNGDLEQGCPTCDAGKSASTVERLVHHIRNDFLTMIPYFLGGVFIASAMKTSLSDTVLSTAAASPVWGPASMMAMAFVLSLCSEADAFPAASFTAFSLPAHMGFLVLGPMLDIKLLLMYRTVFKTKFILAFALSIVAAVAAYVVVLEALLP